MNSVYKKDQVDEISNKLNITKTVVEAVLEKYIRRVREKAENGETVKFLNIFYMYSDSTKKGYQETLAYISTEIGKELSLSSSLVSRILTTYEEIIVEDVRKFYAYVITGLARVCFDEYKDNICKVRITKAKNFANTGVRVIALNSFKRKIEGSR